MTQPASAPKPEDDLDLGDFFEGLGKHLEQAKRESEFAFPIVVTGISFEIAKPIQTETWRKEGSPGQLVRVRSCKEAHGDKTRLGILIGYVPVHSGVRLLREDGEESRGKLVFSHGGDNPLIFIPELRDVVLGQGCWWEPITTPEQLKEISDSQIQNVWYVKLLQELANTQAPEAPAEGGTPR